MAEGARVMARYAAGALACVGFGVGLGIWLIPSAFFWLLFGGG